MPRLSSDLVRLAAAVLPLAFVAAITVRASIDQQSAPSSITIRAARVLDGRGKTHRERRRRSPGHEDRQD